MRFVDGLHEEIKVVIMVQRPSTLDIACVLALDAEQETDSQRGWDQIILANGDMLIGIKNGYLSLIKDRVWCCMGDHHSTPDSVTSKTTQVADMLSCLSVTLPSSLFLTWAMSFLGLAGFYHKFKEYLAIILFVIYTDHSIL
ncbi:hypothetical protein ACJX0J_028656, partial [Zea mays]